MCLSPSIIVNPFYVRHTSDFPMLHIPTRKFFTYYNVSVFDFDYSLFNRRYNGVSSENINDFYAYNVSGETIPIYIEVDCWKCPECIKKRQSQILRRNYVEAACSELPVQFLTLTYDDSNLPENGVSVDDVQKFFKRLRTNFLRTFGYNMDLRYSLFSEYGSLRGRPHYHVILFNYPVHEFKKYGDRFFLRAVDFIRDSWNKGFVSLKTFTNAEGLSYCTKYMLKASHVPFGKNLNFHLCSRSGGAIGSRILKRPDIIAQALTNSEFKVTLRVCGSVKTFHLPKYCIDKILPKSDSLFSPKVKNCVKSLCRKLKLLHSLPFDYFDEDSEKLRSKYDFFFPPHLISRYLPFFSHYINTLKIDVTDYLRVWETSPIDFVALDHSIEDDISFLENYIFDVDELLRMQSERDISMTPYIEHVLKYIQSLPSVSDRASLLWDELTFINSRYLDGQ